MRGFLVKHIFPVLCLSQLARFISWKSSGGEQKRLPCGSRDCVFAEGKDARGDTAPVRELVCPVRIRRLAGLSERDALLSFIPIARIRYEAHRDSGPDIYSRQNAGAAVLRERRDSELLADKRR